LAELAQAVPVSFSGIVTLLLIGAFGVAGYRAGFFDVVLEWDGDTWMIMALVALFFWTIRNEFERRGGGG